MSAPNDGESGPGSVAKSEPRADSGGTDLYHGSSLFANTQSLLDDVLGTPNVPPEKDVVAAVSEVFPSFQGKVTPRLVREKLEEKFGEKLTCYIAAIRKETSRIMTQKKLQGTPRANSIGSSAASAVSFDSPAPAPAPAPASGAGARVNVDTPPTQTIEDSQELGLSQDTAWASTQDTAVSARSAAVGKSTDDVDTRHEKGETQPGSEDSLPLVFPKRLDARKTGATMPVLLELHGKDINVRGDSGAIGRVSLIDPQGESGEQQQEGISASGKRKTPKKTKRGPSKKAKLLAAAQRYTEGSVLRIDLKGDVYNGVMVPSGVTLLGVAMQKDKVQVQGVWNEFMQCTFKGSVMDGMDGKVA